MKKIYNQNLKKIISFGNMPLANAFQKKKYLNNYTFKLKLMFNNNFKLVQLNNYPSPKKMFHNDYAFISSTSSFMKRHFFLYSKSIKKMMGNKKFSICEIGSNDGILLQNFKNNDHVGIEPSKNVFKIAKKKNLNVINEFFNLKLAKKLKIKKLFYDVICGANVFCHIPDLENLFLSVKKIIKKNGILIMEEPYLGEMIKKTSYDQIYDEHIYLFSLHSINLLASHYELKLFHAEPQLTHGGSMRYYITNNLKKKRTTKLTKLLYEEKKLGLNSFEKIKKFNKNCVLSKKKFQSKINNLIKKKQKIYGYGATSKSTTVLNFCNINEKQIKGIFDNSPTKINKYTPNTNIKIIDHKYFKKIKPKYCVLFAWNHYKEIIKKELNFNRDIKWISHINKKNFEKYEKYFI
tara:strand:+ start:1044 stop:2261 length:1218 start_codon:yes stop_codon:yes gene_type:complete